jgi:hypothetical protein
VVHWSSSLMIVSRSYSICKHKFQHHHHQSTHYSCYRGAESVIVVVPLLIQDIYLMSQSIWEWEWNETVVCQCHVIARSLIFVSFWIDQLMQSDAIGIAVVAFLYVGVA